MQLNRFHLFWPPSDLFSVRFCFLSLFSSNGLCFQTFFSLCPQKPIPGLSPMSEQTVLLSIFYSWPSSSFDRASESIHQSKLLYAWQIDPLLIYFQSNDRFLRHFSWFFGNLKLQANSWNSRKNSLLESLRFDWESVCLGTNYRFIQKLFVSLKNRISSSFRIEFRYWSIDFGFRTSEVRFRRTIS